VGGQASNRHLIQVTLPLCRALWRLIPEGAAHHWLVQKTMLSAVSKSTC
jgi:hypothetical protein